MVFSSFVTTAGWSAYADKKLYSDITKLAVFGLSYPIAALRDLSSLRYMSTVGVCSVIYVAIVLLAETPSYYKDFHKKENFVLINWDWNMFVSFSIVVFSYTCTTVAF